MGEKIEKTRRVFEVGSKVLTVVIVGGAVIFGLFLLLGLLVFVSAFNINH